MTLFFQTLDLKRTYTDSWIHGWKWNTLFQFSQFSCESADTHAKVCLLFKLGEKRVSCVIRKRAGNDNKRGSKMMLLLSRPFNLNLKPEFFSATITHYFLLINVASEIKLSVRGKITYRELVLMYLLDQFTWNRDKTWTEDTTNAHSLHITSGSFRGRKNSGM